jgi:hypothetical protein
MIRSSDGRRRGVGILVAFCLSMVATGALAYTAEQQQACTGDAMQLCGAYVPDVDRITACMVQNKARLTPACRAQFGPEPAALRSPGSARTKPLNLKPRKPAKPRKQAAS